MKKGDRVRIIGIDVQCTVDSIGSDGVHVWWPCPEYGLHEKIVDPRLLELITGNGHGPKPTRTKDHPHGPEHNLQRVTNVIGV